MITASDLREHVSGTLRAFVKLTLSPSGLKLSDCTYHEREDRRWIGLPGKPQLDSDGRVCKDPATGKTLHTPLVEIVGKAERERFQQAALAAVDRLLGSDGGGA
jgi:hypothetical protein